MSACVIFILHQKIQKMAKYTFWYQLTRIVPDKVQRAVKWLSLCVLLLVVSLLFNRPFDTACWAGFLPKHEPRLLFLLPMRIRTLNWLKETERTDFNDENASTVPYTPFHDPPTVPERREAVPHCTEVDIFDRFWTYFYFRFKTKPFKHTYLQMPVYLSDATVVLVLLTECIIFVDNIDSVYYVQLKVCAFCVQPQSIPTTQNERQVRNR